LYVLNFSLPVLIGFTLSHDFETLTFLSNAVEIKIYAIGILKAALILKNPMTIGSKLKNCKQNKNIVKKLRIKSRLISLFPITCEL